MALTEVCRCVVCRRAGAQVRRARRRAGVQGVCKGVCRMCRSAGRCPRVPPGCPPRVSPLGVTQKKTVRMSLPDVPLWVSPSGVLHGVPTRVSPLAYPILMSLVVSPHLVPWCQDVKAAFERRAGNGANGVQASCRGRAGWCANGVQVV